MQIIYLYSFKASLDTALESLDKILTMNEKRYDYMKEYFYKLPSRNYSKTIKKKKFRLYNKRKMFYFLKSYICILDNILKDIKSDGNLM